MYRAVYMGDYRVRHAGDFLGIGKVLGGIGKGVSKVLGAAGKVAGVAGAVLPGPLGTAAKLGSKVLGGAGRVTNTFPVLTGTAAMSMVPTIQAGGLKINPKAILPGGEPFVTYGAGSSRRRMNVANPKALRRAIRRQSGFVKLARRALKGSGYKITSRGMGVRRVARRR